MRSDEILNKLSGSGTVAPVLVVENQTVKDIIALIKYKHAKCAADYDRIAARFWAGNVYETCKKLWTFCKNNIQYEIESEDLQTVSSPAVILERGAGDCKHYSLFVGGVLDALKRQGKKINWFYRFASYSILDQTPGHVFIVAMDGGREIWVDPVLNEFDFHKPYTYAMDKVIQTGGKVGALGAIHQVYVSRGNPGLSKMKGHEVVGATTAQVGQIIEKVSPSLAAIPVVGWIAAGVGTVGGFFLATFGNQYSVSTQVRWLDQLFEFYVLGHAGVTSDNKVNQNNVPMAHNWFATVLGVPVYDRLRFNSLAGKTGNPTIDNSLVNRVNNFLQYPEIIKAGVTVAQATAAAQIAGSLPLNGVPGSWAGATAAPSLISVAAPSVPAGYPASQLSQIPGMNYVQNFAAQLGVPDWVILAGGGVLIYLLFFNKKHHRA